MKKTHIKKVKPAKNLYVSPIGLACTPSGGDDPDKPPKRP